MTYLARGYYARAYLDSSSLALDLSAPPPAGDNIAGTDTLTFGGSATLTAAVAAASTGSAVIFGGSGVLTGLAALTAETTTEKLTFGGYATLTAEVAVVPPPATAPWIKKVTVNMPAPTTFRKGRPTA